MFLMKQVFPFKKKNIIFSIDISPIVFCSIAFIVFITAL